MSKFASLKQIAHLTTEDELVSLEKLGYELNLGTKDAADFVNTHFPNLDLLNWYTKIEELFKGKATPPVNRSIEFSELKGNPTIRISFLDDKFDSTTEGLFLIRDLTKNGEKIQVEHTAFRLPGTARGQGLSKKIIAVSVQQYINMGIDHIRVSPGLTHGGLVWAKYDFRATDKNGITRILQEAYELLGDGMEFDMVKAVYDRYYQLNPNGERFPVIRWTEFDFMEEILMGSEWEGILDFKNEEQLINFMQYVDQEQ
jgi:hypothetical protein